MITEDKRTRVRYNWLQHYSEDSLREESEEHGFTVKGFYSNVTGTTISPESLEIAIAAKKFKNSPQSKKIK